MGILDDASSASSVELPMEPQKSISDLYPSEAESQKEVQKTTTRSKEADASSTALSEHYMEYGLYA